ncbi:MAG: amino acid permease [Sphingopyxis sp.]|nr:amino acid permease [Sphingopyxis sp.]
MSIFERKTIEHIKEASESSPLRRDLSLPVLTLLGVGATIGAGVFVLTGNAAANYAGPAVALSFVFAAVACLFAGLCYAELSSMIPVSGSAYTYSYVSMGEIVAWLIGWNLVLEYMFAVSAVAVGWSGYFSAFVRDLGLTIPEGMTEPLFAASASGGLALSGAVLNFPAVAVVLAMTGVLSLGMRASAGANALMVAIKVGVILLVIGVGSFYVDAQNYIPFVPEPDEASGRFGWAGVITAAGVVFYAYIGFDAVSATSLEAKNPRRDVPLAILLTLAICTALYVGMSVVMTGLAPYALLNVPHPIYVAIEHVGPALAWLKPIIGISVIVGLASTILVALYGQTRVFYAMAMDGLIPQIFSRINLRTNVPAFNTWFVGCCAALVAGMFPLAMLGELISIGTLLAFSIVCLGVLVLRFTAPDAERPFRVRYIWPVSLAGLGMCVYMMLSLPGDTWQRFGVWLALGGAIYLFYGYRSSKLRRVVAFGAMPR